MISRKCEQCKHFIIAKAGEGKIYGCDRSKCEFEPTTKNNLGVDCISRVDAERILTDLYHSDICDYYPLDILEDIKALPSVTPQEPRWIPVSERLPEKNVEVLATTEWGAVTIAEMYSANDWFIHEGTTNAETDEIATWMPLPKPYEPQESEDKE